MCGIIGIYAKQNVNQEIYDGLTTLQHRGQDAAGMATLDRRTFNIQKDNGLVRDAIRTRHMKQLQGHAGIGHVRYPTAGSSSATEAQPFYVNSPFGLSLVHNGNLINTGQLSQVIYTNDRRHLNTNSDSEIIINILAHELSQFKGEHLSKEDIFAAFRKLYQRVSGAFAAIAMLGRHGMIAFRDANAIRPLLFGKRETAKGSEYIVASESVALDVLGFEFIRNVAPGEVVYFPFHKDTIFSEICAESTKYTPCIFEHVYLARPDSIIDDVSVYKTRLRQGEYLAKKCRRVLSKKDLDEIDVVIPVPDSGRTAAHSIAKELGKKFREGFIKNRYIGRTFIMPGQDIRQKSIRQKLNPIALEFKGKNVMLVDDSIVRGNTSKKIVELVREAGAKKIYFLSAAPPVKFPNVYGIDIPTRAELIASELNEEEIAHFMGADQVIYQDLADLIQSGLEGNSNLDGFEDSVFSGNYCTNDVSAEYLQKVEMMRNDSTKQLKMDSAFNDDNLTLI